MGYLPPGVVCQGVEDRVHASLLSYMAAGNRACRVNVSRAVHPAACQVSHLSPPFGLVQDWVLKAEPVLRCFVS
jgi:hypothetical protein